MDFIWIPRFWHFFMVMFYILFRNLKWITPVVNKNRTHLSSFEWQASANFLFLETSLFSCAVHRRKHWRKFSLSVYTILWTTSYFNQERFSLFILKTLSEIFSVLQKEMKHFDIWRRMKRVWSLMPRRNDIKTGFYA